ncbi:aminopeptidase [Holzapfeliella floricola]|uniref:Aminopeptidase S n=1 Tax=Holzapfeliella floricola DSM 23037 = JCM 16512 TaxID=1423744 RepID=A0A0R2DK39_9LACO|nr:aminopeptidase [Holzapfeliella floricola]KRN04480.1 aminopeptidase S [Holzapfeliella floricola DSM 23037 = JCM 16512]
MTLKNFDTLLSKYADLTIQTGVAVKPGDTIVLQIATNQRQFAYLLTEKAYQQGASEVIVKWQDETLNRLNLLHADEERLTTFSSSQEAQINEWLDKKVKRISVISNNPDALSDVDQNRLAQMQSTMTKGMLPIRRATQNNDLSWTIVGAASEGWAKHVFPDVSLTEAVDKLWDEIFKATRIYANNPIKAWQEHKINLRQKGQVLNDKQFTALHYTSDITDITIGLPKNHIWHSAGAVNRNGEEFMPNMPTEEVFTAPDFRHIDGVIASTKPLSYSGQLIEGIKVTFKNGQITEITADKGQETLEHLIQTDDGAKSLGEVALVPYSSPISQSKIIFFNTLFDENASNHVAIGAAYPFSIENGTKMSPIELRKNGLNVSQTHVDFMVGSDKMNIEGISADGSRFQIFQNGEWAF